MNTRRKRYCVFKCDDEIYTPMHRFPHPVKRPALFAAWMSAVGDKLQQIDHMKIFHYKRVCDRHFDHSQKIASNRLIWSAIPNINLKRIQLSTASIVAIDHNYSCCIRGLGMTFTANTSGPTSENFETISEPNPNPTAFESKNTVGNTVKKDSVIVENTTVAVAIDNSRDVNDNDDDVVPDTPVPESEESRRDLFSWEKAETIVADDTMIVSDFTMAGPDLTLDFGDISMYKDEVEQSSKDDQTGSETLDYKCNRCGEKITGFRYTCVQCVDWDLCAACEAHASHDTHYVLRVPGLRPYKEVQAILTAVRQQLLCENLFLTESTASIKEELIDEDAEVPEVTSDPEGDPLEAWNISQHDDDDTLENNLEPNKDGHLSPNRRRASIDSLNNTQNLTTRTDSSYSSQVTEIENDPIETNKDNPNVDQTEFNYSEPIEIIDIDKLTRTHEQTREDPEPNDSDMYTDIIQITKENDLEMLADRLDDILDSTKSKPNSDTYTDIIQITKENDIEMLADGLDNIPDTTKSKPQHTEQQEIVDMSSDESSLNTFTHTNEYDDDGTHNEETGTCTTETGALSESTETRSQTNTRMHRKRIITRSIAKTNRQRYKIFLPPGDQWKQLLMTMLQSRVTVQLEDVIRKMEVHKTPERNKKTEINEI